MIDVRGGMVARDIIVTILLSSCDAVLEERKARRSNQRESRATQAQTIDAPRSPPIGCKVVRYVSASLSEASITHRVKTASTSSSSSRRCSEGRATEA